MGRAFLLCEPVVIEDVLTDPSYDRRTQGNLLSVTRYRTFMGMPIMREGRAIGVIGCARRQIRAFTPAQVELVRTFADQAVIAIENARLLSELRDREAELRVTFDNMADAVAMFDEALHLAAWNRNFQKLLQLPEDFLGERPGFDNTSAISPSAGSLVKPSLKPRSLGCARGCETITALSAPARMARSSKSVITRCRMAELS